MSIVVVEEKKQKKQGAGPGVAAFIMGVISLVLFLMLINIPLSILAIILAIIGITQYEKKGLAIVGLVCAVLSITIGIGSFALMMSNDNLLSVAESMYDDDQIIFTNRPPWVFLRIDVFKRTV